MANPLTPRQREVLQAIRLLTKRNRRSPTVRELMEELQIASPNGVVCHLKPLERKGAIIRNAEVARGIEVAGTCPVCGHEVHR